VKSTVAVDVNRSELCPVLNNSISISDYRRLRAVKQDVFVQCGELQDQQAVGAVPGEAVCAGGRDAVISITVSFTTLLSNKK
jgi:hypothetical protein